MVSQVIILSALAVVFLGVVLGDDEGHNRRYKFPVIVVSGGKGRRGGYGGGGGKVFYSGGFYGDHDAGFGNKGGIGHGHGDGNGYGYGGYGHGDGNGHGHGHGHGYDREGASTYGNIYTKTFVHLAHGHHGVDSEGGKPFRGSFQRGGRFQGGSKGSEGYGGYGYGYGHGGHGRYDGHGGSYGGDAKFY